MAGELQNTLASLQRQAEALGELQRRCAHLRDAGRPAHAHIDAVASAIDAGIDACLLIAERAAGADPAGEWRGAVSELERQIRRLGVLRAEVLGLYLSRDATVDGRSRRRPRAQS